MDAGTVANDHIMIWSDVECEAVVTATFPGLVRWFNNESKGMYKADICRCVDVLFLFCFCFGMGLGCTRTRHPDVIVAVVAVVVGFSRTGDGHKSPAGRHLRTHRFIALQGESRASRGNRCPPVPFSHFDFDLSYLNQGG